MERASERAQDSGQVLELGSGQALGWELELELVPGPALELGSGLALERELDLERVSEPEPALARASDLLRCPDQRPWLGAWWSHCCHLHRRKQPRGTPQQ